MFQKWCEITSCNGIIDLYEAKDNKIRFVFWTVVMLIMFGASLWFTYRTVQGYIDTPIVTNVATIPNSTMALPEVMICYHGGLNVSAMKEHDVSDHLIRQFQISLNLGTRPPLNYTDSQIELVGLLKRNGWSLYQFVDAFSYECEDIVTYSKRPNPSLSGRCRDVRKMMTSSGNCYVFYNNGGQWYPGIWGGMTIRLQTPNGSFIEHYPDDASDAHLQKGFSVTLETSLTFQQSKRALLVPSNTKAEVTLHPVHYVRSRIGKACAEDSDMYTSNSCPWDCWQQELLSTDGCAPLDFVIHRNESGIDVCNPFKYPPKNFSIARVISCTAKCFIKCDEWMYEPTVTYSNLVSTNGRSSIGFGYHTLQYTEIVEVEAFTIDMAVANVGGQSGLWLGASIVTFIQAFYYLVWTILQKLRPKRKTKKITVSVAVPK